MEIKKLIIHDSGDPSVGIFPQTWEVDVPLYITGEQENKESEKEDLERFRKQMVDIYGEYANGRIWSRYDFELKAEEEMYREAEEKFDNPDFLNSDI